MIEKCDSFLKQLRGEMFRKKIKPLLFIFNNERIMRLHSWFCFGKIDLVFLDKNFKVVEIKKGWKNWSFYTSKNKCKYLLELPEGSIVKDKIKLGSKPEDFRKFDGNAY